MFGRHCCTVNLSLRTGVPDTQLCGGHRCPNFNPQRICLFGPQTRIASKWPVTRGAIQMCRLSTAASSTRNRLYAYIENQSERNLGQAINVLSAKDCMIDLSA